MAKPDGWAKAWGLAAHVEPAGCMTCGVRSASALTNSDSSVTSVGFFGIPAGSRVYKGVLQGGQWVPGRDVTMPGQWQGQSWVIPADSGQVNSAQVYVIQPQAGVDYHVTANPRSVGQDGIIFVDAQASSTLTLRRTNEPNGYQFGSNIRTQPLGHFDSPIPSISKNYK